MAYDQNVQYLSLAFWQIIMTAGPILAIALGIGLLIGLIQAATSIQEMTLSFVPKLFVVLAANGTVCSSYFKCINRLFCFHFRRNCHKGFLNAGSRGLSGISLQSLPIYLLLNDFC